MAIVIVYVLLAAVLGGVLWRGGAPERLAAAILLGSTFADRIYHAIVGEARYKAVDLGHLANDLVTLALLLALALRANRVWPLVVCALQLIMSVAHVAEEVYPQGAPLAYWLMTFPPVVAQVVISGIGTVAHAGRMARLGPYRAWRLH